MGDWCLTRLKAGIVLTALWVCLWGQTAHAADRVLVYAAASTRDILRDAVDRYHQRHETTIIKLSFASSATLASQILAGAPADVFLSANKKWMASVAKAGLTAPGQTAIALSNRLALIVPAASPARFSFSKPENMPSLLRGGRLAIGSPKAVPLGVYSRQALTALGLWDKFRTRLAPASDARHTLAFVERGETALGIVYQSDAIASSRVRTLGLFPASSHEPIEYPLALLKGGVNNTAAKSFYHDLIAGTLAEIALEHGFKAPK